MNYQMKNLVKEAKAKNKDKAAVIVEKLKPLIIKSIKKYSFTNESYEDLFMDGQLKVLECIKDYSEEKRVPFLYYVKISLKYYYLNKKENIETISADKDGLIDILVSSENVEEDYHKENLVKNLKKHMKNLDYISEKIINMYYFEKKNLSEIAKILGKTYFNVAKMKERALRKLRNELKK